MEPTAFDCDEVLTDFLTDYIDGNLNKGEKNAFESYLDNNEREKEFARKAMQGKKTLSGLTNRIKAPEDFEARLALRIALDKVNHASDLVNQ